jgi:hypothetical protein
MRYQAKAPAMNVEEMMAIQPRLDSPGNSAAGAVATSVRQRSQQPARKRIKRAPDRNMAKA